MKTLANLARLPAIAAFASVAASAPSAHAGHYNNFSVAVYVTATQVQKMADPAWLASKWAKVDEGLHVDKVYLETFREGFTPTPAAIASATKFFRDRGVTVAGGIATVLAGTQTFTSFCYTDPNQRRLLQQIVELTARDFDEFILDDFFFDNSKTDSDIRTKGNKSWSRFRLDLMAEVSRNLVVGPAKRVNPRVKVVIKFPNWYDHFQFDGYNLDDEPRIFDGIYTGTETRDGAHTAQHLQPYLGYDVMRYFENIKPGGNGGGWIDPYDWRDKERYGEQIALTLFGKAREITFFNFEDILEPMPATPASPVTTSLPVYAGSILRAIDGFAGQLGRPVGLKTYKPLQSSGEDFLYDFLGTMGLPLELVPTFPRDASTVLLTEAARFDPAILDEMKQHLRAGKNVVVTSGFVAALQGHGIEDIIELRVGAQRAAAHEFALMGGPTYRSAIDLHFPEVFFPTNDAWMQLSAVNLGVGYPVLLRDTYSQGTVWVLTVPDNFAELYALPPEALDAIRTAVSGDLPVHLEGPSQVALFEYEGGKFIVQSFVPPGGKAVNVRAVVDGRIPALKDVVSGRALTGVERGHATVFDITLPPSGYRVFEAPQASVSLPSRVGRPGAQ